ncbi:putative HMG-box domain containing protein [Lyophyllum shimeji]|uniref:HMG-box domain containing protein n=1 Tax=Lyophyllum shimeji TaxID=47721 RepID=A0A9P3PU58_LYOSH|nr:putative HMG-box domain containing protein [Lyophyllum shimeji]
MCMSARASPLSSHFSNCSLIRRTGSDAKTRAQMRASQHPSFFHDGSRQDGQDERGSVSDSDDGGYAPYQEAAKGELDLEDDHAALTSQTLNTDGTPKRPMNAFMIFARRRRSQVSAENQALRTGEISKILSREWNTMQAAEKQFYQDQARQLKDTFNTKYPDYVYRRRPNNSRRKRKPDAAEVLVSDKQSTLG